MAQEKPFTLVFLESPYAGDVKANLEYTRTCMRDCIDRGEAPFASHALYTQDGVLDDTIPYERQLGIEAGQAFRRVCARTVVYTDRGLSPGMLHGIAHAEQVGHSIEYRTIPGWGQ